MQEFCTPPPSRFAGLPPAPFGEWRGVAARAPDPFSPGFAAVAPLIGKWFAELPERRDRPGEHYLPIEAWRDPAAGAVLHGDQPVARAFRSSGTTSETRSLVRFSPAGLECYRQESLYVFFHVLREVMGAAGEGDRAPLGLSLVPPVAAWPESSLAQMVAWIGEIVPVRYVEEDELTAAVHAARGAPVWVFGTAFHWVNVLDRLRDGLGELPLPPGSVLFETGGTKGRSRAVTRADLYAELTLRLNVADERIVSEYGMCELAAQAYDFRRPGETGPRRFRFPAWVDARVVTGPGQVARAGRGALLVEDPLRIDAPWALRTEDLVEMDASGFSLCGRIPAAPLKGCSLNAETFEKAEQGSANAQRVGRPFGDIQARAECLAALWPRFLAKAPALFAAELGSAAAGIAATADLEASAPTSADAWRRAALVAAADEPLPAHWLFVLPESHSVVGLYPLTLGYVLGLRMTVRLPRSLASASPLSLLIDMLRDLDDAHLTTCDEALRITDASHPFDAILAYGDDATIQQIGERAGVPVQGFGNRFALALVDDAAFAARAPDVVKDSLSLAQAGCLASRLTVYFRDASFDDAGGDAFEERLVARLAEESRAFWRAPVPADARIGFDLDAWRYARLGFTVHAPHDDLTPLIVTRHVTLSDVTPALIEQTIARRAFTLPVLIVSDGNALQFVKISIASQAHRIACVTSNEDSCLTKSDYGGLSFRPLGAANAPSWNGCHEDRPLFARPTLR